MAYYKKRYKKRGGSSRIVKMKFQSFFDISTSSTSMRILSVSAGGREVVKRLGPFFQAYKYYRLGGVSIKLIPASTLPVDPTGLSMEEGEPGVDPRDQLTPGMCRITNGEDVLEDITGMDADAQHSLYNAMLLDPRWFKWMLQSGVKRFGKPRYWQVGQLHQDKWPGADVNYPFWNIAGSEVQGTAQANGAMQNGETPVTPKYAVGSSRYGFFQTGRRGVLGWMPTDGLQRLADASAEHLTELPFIASVPEIELFKILMPIAYKTKYYYRAFVTETVYFKEPIVNAPFMEGVGAYRSLDVFRSPMIPYAISPKVAATIASGAVDHATGGNDGDD